MSLKPYLEELLAIFAQTEDEQERYFPEFHTPVWFEDQPYQAETKHARFVALCLLASRAKRGETTKDEELGELYTEINSLASLLIESTDPYEWLVWHPRTVRADDHVGINPDPQIYGVWAVVRRLCREALRRSGAQVRLRPFYELFSDFITPLKERPER